MSTAGGSSGELMSAPTPQPATPAGCYGGHRRACRAACPRPGGGVGIALPSVVQKGMVRTAANIDHVLDRHRRGRLGIASALGGRPNV